MPSCLAVLAKRRENWSVDVGYGLGGETSIKSGEKAVPVKKLPRNGPLLGPSRAPFFLGDRHDPVLTRAFADMCHYIFKWRGRVFTPRELHSVHGFDEFSKGYFLESIGSIVSGTMIVYFYVLFRCLRDSRGSGTHEFRTHLVMRISVFVARSRSFWKYYQAVWVRICLILLGVYRSVYLIDFSFVSGESKGKPLLKESRHDSRKRRGELRLWNILEITSVTHYLSDVTNRFHGSYTFVTTHNDQQR